MKHVVCGLAALALVAATARDARAAASCSFMSATGPAFGSYDVFKASSTDSAGNLSFTCTGGASLTITLSAGLGMSYTPRLLQRMGGGATLPYNLYLDGNHTQIWGDGNGSTFVNGPLNPVDGAINMISIYGSIPPNQDVPLGTYNDTVVVTLNF
ncbi:MAG TPA: spore coat U domain-containing protein [Polyangia bacterium]|nr:spore coat U domain-containing protein [Polyangia bacterium]